MGKKAAAGTPAKPLGSATDRIKVRATQAGYYGHTRRRIGDVFWIDNEQAFSTKWMERVDPETPESVTTSNDQIRREHDEILASRQAGLQVDPSEGNGPTGNTNVLG